MEVDDFANTLQKSIDSITRRKVAKLEKDEKNKVHAMIGAWFRDYRPLFAKLLGDDQGLLQIDQQMQNLQKYTTKASARASYLWALRRCRNIFEKDLLQPLTRLYWENAASENFTRERSHEIMQMLENIDASIKDSYDQVLRDLEDSDRVSYKGTANELREVVREVLSRLAPDKEVTRQEWWQQTHQKESEAVRPTMAERTKYIMLKRGSGDAAVKSATGFADMVESRLGQVVRSSYERASAAVHSARAQKEISTQLPYVNALLLELLR